MPSRTCAPEPLRRSIALALTLLALHFGSACSEKHEQGPEPAEDFGSELEGLAERLGAALQFRKEIRDTPFYQGSEVADELATMSIRIDACVVNIRRLAGYDEEADQQNLPEADRLRFKEVELRALREHLDHYESCFASFDTWRSRDGELFFSSQAKVLYSNQVLNELIAGGIPTFADQALMRDLSQRMLDARRYWCQELANCLRGLDPDQEVLGLALGTARAVAQEVGPVHERMKAASADFHRLTNGRKGLADRLAWSRSTLARHAEDEGFRARAAAALDALAPEIAALDGRAATELSKVLEDDPGGYERRDALVAEQSALLARLNAIVLTEAQKRGWPLPK